MKTGVNATKLAIGAFVVPYIFCLNPAMLFVETTAFKVVMIIITSLMGIFGVAAAMNGYLFKKQNWLIRIMLCVGGLLMMDPTMLTDVIGLCVMAVAFLWQYFSARKAPATA